ncbi:unnamed protein product [Kuraishia capsulata CBS 1993]|uniref:E3 ubiquitin-protein ligase n=1 Tax=Kuraishia capsulata CBS 1993 TaxID=1382522 RepID=W6MJ13_9ASCO|nr:uncharacterized protein KUCA_T00002162001 [Kuraishia capsulata CBS 1993]CDK26191.1 unnamed protein product [Kuraishia capsulata CBS 1993]
MRTEISKVTQGLERIVGGQCAGLSPRTVRTSLKEVKHKVYALLYYSLASNEPAILNDMFPGFFNQELELPHTAEDLMHETYKGFHVPEGDAADTYSHTGRSCARKFEHGEPIYACNDCGIDPTTVLCSYCFNRDDHEDHDVGMRIATSENEGICDCGDVTSWVRDLNCMCEIERAERDDIPQFVHDLRGSATETVAAALDYVLGVYTSFDLAFRPQLSPTEMIRHFQMLDPAPDYAESKQFCLLLWNDEYHSMPEAFEAVKNVTGWTKNIVDKCVVEIDKNGFSYLKTGDITSVHRDAQELRDLGYRYEIIPKLHFARFLISGIIIEWLRDASDHHLHEVQSSVRTSIAERCLEKYDNVPRFPPLMGTPDSNSSFLSNYSALLDNDGRIPKGQLDVTGSRIQYFFFFEPRFPKGIRSILHSTFAPILISSLDTRVEFARLLTEIYQQLMCCMACCDREYMHHSLGEVFFQLFACPVTTEAIIAAPQRIEIIAYTTRQVCMNELIISPPPAFTKPNAESFRIFKCRAAAIRILENLVECVEYNEKHLGFFRKSFVDELCELLSDFGNLTGIQRKTGDHVLIDTTLGYQNLRFLSLLYDIIEHFAKMTSELTDNSASEEIVDALEAVVLFINRSISASSFSMPQTSVGSGETDYLLNPLQAFCSTLVYNYHGFDFRWFERIYSASSAADFRTLLIHLGDRSLCRTVLMAQIDSGHWARNGTMIGHEADLCKEISGCTDLFLFQSTLLAGAPVSSLIENVISKFKFDQWLVSPDAEYETEYLERSTSLFDALVVFFYQVSSCWDWLGPSYDKSSQALGDQLVTLLIEESATFSDLKSDVRTTDDKIETFLKQFCTYKPPSGVSGSGRYSLKEDVLKNIDPMRLPFSSASPDELQYHIRKVIAKLDNCTEDDVVFVPKPVQLPANRARELSLISEFVSHPLLLKFVDKLLSHHTKNESDSYLLNLLHLVHRIVLDVSSVTPLADSAIASSLFKISRGQWAAGGVRYKAMLILREVLQRDAEMAVQAQLFRMFGEDTVIDAVELKAPAVKKNLSKKLANKRLKKLMGKMAKQQQQFKENNPSSDNELAQDEQRVCISCKLGARENDPLVIFWEQNVSSVFRMIGLGPESKKFRNVWNTCGHFIHLGCFDGLNVLPGEKKKCPFCGFSSNEYLVSHPVDCEFPALTAVERITLRDIEAAFFPVKNEPIVRSSDADNMSAQTGSHFDELCEALVDTIKMVEIASRSKASCGEDAYSERQLTLVRSAFQSFLSSPEYYTKTVGSGDAVSPLLMLFTGLGIVEDKFQKWAELGVLEYRSVVAGHDFERYSGMNAIDYQPLTEDQERLVFDSYGSRATDSQVVLKIYWNLAFVVLQKYREIVLLLMAIFPSFALESAEAKRGTYVDKINLIAQKTGLPRFQHFVSLCGTAPEDDDAGNPKEYLGVVGLHPLKHKLKDYIDLLYGPMGKKRSRSFSGGSTEEYIVCLICGSDIRLNSLKIGKCEELHDCAQKGQCIAFNPSTNSLLFLAGHDRLRVSTYKTPYVTSHGEPAPGLMRSQDLALLDPLKWQNLNDKYLNMTLHQYQTVYETRYFDHNPIQIPGLGMTLVPLVNGNNLGLLFGEEPEDFHQLNEDSDSDGSDERYD